MIRLRRSLLPVLLLSTFLFAFSPFSAVAQQPNQLQWTGEQGLYPFNWSYSPQKAVGPSNVNNLQVSWIWPVPSAPKAYAGQESITFTPLVVNGIVYTVTNFHLIVALSASDGKIIWQKSLPLLTFKNVQPLVVPGLNSTGHYHAIWYTTKIQNKPILWVVSNNETVWALNALTGDFLFHFPIIGPNIPGNFGRYGTITPQIVIDEDRGVLITGPAVSEGADAGRGYFAGYDVTQTPPKLLWRTFIIPPQDGSDPNWSIKSVQNMSYAYIFDGKKAIDLKALSPSQLNDMLYADWGNFGFNGTHSFAGASVGWGGTWTYDPATGIAYVGTAQPTPDYNASVRPGPNLWSDSILAIDERTGKIVWAFQATPHDLWDIDCAWGFILANATIGGSTQKVLYKACKSGVLFALDAATGKMFWYFDPPAIRRTQYEQPLNPLDKAQMTKPWQWYPLTGERVAHEFWIESNPAYDPTTNTIYFGVYNQPERFQIVPVKGPGVPWHANWGITPATTFCPCNTTIYAVDGSTGKPKWSYFIDGIGFRGGLTVSNGVLYVPTADGFLRYVDANTGSEIGRKFIGAALLTQPAIAADANGNIKLIIPGSGTSSSIGLTLGFPGTPGYLLALAPTPSAITTVTSISTSLVTSTSVQTVPGPTTGIPPEAFYGAVAVAVIFVIATGVLAARRRAPPS